MAGTPDLLLATDVNEIVFEISMDAVIMPKSE
jgi:hypothetical protein